MLTKFWRYFLFFFFVIAFLIAAPAVVFYTAGYRFNLSTGQVAQTGLLSITSIPKGADITIDDEKKAERTPSIINNAVPGIHRVHLEKEGYSTWEKQLEVNSRQSTFVSDAVLFLLETETVDPEIFDQAEVDPVFGTIAFLKERKELWLKMPFSSQTVALLGISKKKFETAEIVWSPLGRFLLFTTVSNKISQSHLIDTQTNEIWTLPTHTSFLFDVGDSLSGYLLNDEVISKVNFRTQEIKPLVFSANAIRTDAHDVFVIQQNSEHSVLSRIDQNGVAQILAYLPLGEYQFEHTPNDLLLLRDKSRERLLLVDRSGGSEPILLLADADTWDWSPSGTDLIFSDGFGIELYKTLSHTRETITRLSEPIHHLLWYPLGNVIAYQTATQIVALEMDRRGEQNKTVLLDGPSFNQFWFDEDGTWIQALTDVKEKHQAIQKRLQK